MRYLPTQIIVPASKVLLKLYSCQLMSFEFYTGTTTENETIKVLYCKVAIRKPFHIN